MKNSERFFTNYDCRYFPCHDCDPKAEEFNCLFCYCPLYHLDSCPGNPRWIKRPDRADIKDCSGCMFPHWPENYEAVNRILKNH